LASTLRSADAESPRTVIVSLVWAGALDWAVSVSVLPWPAVTVEGENVPETPCGRLLTESVMVSGAPETTRVVKEKLVLDPAATVCAAGVTARVKSLGVGGFTSMVTVAPWLPVLDAPVMERVASPREAPTEAWSVSVADSPATTELGAKLAVTPAGSPEIAKAIGTALPVVTAVVTEKVVLSPAGRSREEGKADTLKSFTGGAGVTVRVAVVVRVPDGAVPMTEKGVLEAGAAAEAVRVSVALELPVTDPGVKDAVTPAGRPAADRATVWALPEVTVELTVKVVIEPAETVRMAGITLSV
jgi:hypothetical protein